MDAWRFTTADPDVAERVAELFGGEVLDNEHAERVYQVFTEAETLPIKINQGGIGVSLVLWGNGVKTAETDGTHLIEDGVLTDKICAHTFEKSLDDILGMGFKPNLRLNFSIEDNEDLGSFALFSSSKTAMEHFARKEAELEEIDGSVSSTITLEFVETKKGGFRKPQIGDLAHGGLEEPPAKVETSTKKPAAKKAPAKKAAKKATRKRVSK